MCCKCLICLNTGRTAKEDTKENQIVVPIYEADENAAQQSLEREVSRL